MKAIHIADKTLLNPTNPITVNLIGAGGTGSNMIMALAKMNYSLIALGAPGLQVNLYDDDKVTPATVGRQMFAESELDMYKAVILINRVNRFWGTNWKAVTEQYKSACLDRYPNGGKATVFITCVDNVGARFDIATAIKDLARANGYDRDKPLYWMDMGNGKFTGQAVLSTVNPVKQPESEKYRTVETLPMVTDEFKERLNEADTGDDTPSCSTAEALAKQDLFINPTLANEAASLLWQLLREGMIFNRGFFMNLQEHRTVNIKVA